MRSFYLSSTGRSWQRARSRVEGGRASDADLHWGGDVCADAVGVVLFQSVGRGRRRLLPGVERPASQLPEPDLGAVSDVARTVLPLTSTFTAGAPMLEPSFCMRMPWPRSEPEPVVPSVPTVLLVKLPSTVPVPVALTNRLSPCDLLPVAVLFETLNRRLPLSVCETLTATLLFVKLAPETLHVAVPPVPE